jgi:hypothetical protein
MLNAMTKVAWKMFEIPSAKHRNMQSTPVLVKSEHVVRRIYALGWLRIAE